MRPIVLCLSLLAFSVFAQGRVASGGSGSVGPAGPTGETGATGATGATGPAGPATSNGWTSDGGSTATTLRAAVGPAGFSTDGGILIDGLGGAAGSNIVLSNYSQVIWGGGAQIRSYFSDFFGELRITNVPESIVYMSINQGTGVFTLRNPVLGNGTSTTLLASGTQTKGTFTLSAGTATKTVLSGAQCVCGLSTGTVWPLCAVSGTTLTITGTGTDTGTYVCL